MKKDGIIFTFYLTCFKERKGDRERRGSENEGYEELILLFYCFFFPLYCPNFLKQTNSKKEIEEGTGQNLSFSKILKKKAFLFSEKI